MREEMRNFLIYVIVFGILGGTGCLWWVTYDRFATAYKEVTKQIQTHHEQRKALLEEIDKIK